MRSVSLKNILRISIMEERFTLIYDKNRWGGGSGTGSKMSRNQQKYIDMLMEVIDKYEVKTICDVGCGDWQFSKYIDWGDRKYDGIDCVKSVVETNVKEYQKDNIKFYHKTISDDYIPTGYDLIIIKDVIQHWTDEDIMKYFTQLIDNNKYVFATSGFQFNRDKSKNEKEWKRDINNYHQYHPVDIYKYPLNQFRKKCISIQQYHTKQMCLFKGL